MSFALYKIGPTGAEFFTLDKDHTVGVAGGGFVMDKELALQFSRSRDVKDFQRKYASFLPLRTMEIPDA